MEIFQNLWTILNSINPELTSALMIPLVIVEIIITFLLFSTLLNIKYTKKQAFLYISIFSLFSMFALLFIPAPFNSFLNLLVCPIIIMIIFKTGFFKAIFAEIMPYFIFVIIGLIVGNIYVVLSNLSLDAITYTPIHKISCSLYIYLFAFCIYIFFKKYSLNFFMFDNKILNKGKINLLLNFIIGIAAIYFQSYLATFYITYIPWWLTFCSILVILLYFCISIYSLSRTIQLEITSQLLEQEKSYNKTLTVLYDNIRGFRHDFNNIVQSLGGYISSNNIDGLKTYYDGLLKDCKISNNLSVLNPDLINNPAIYSLLCSKYYKATQLGITVNLSVFLDLSSLNVNIYEFVRILGILLDNAIEASVQCKEKIINIDIRKQPKSSKKLFVIENTYLNQDIDLKKIFQKGYTSKTQDNCSHGLGLWEVKKFLNKYNNLNLQTFKEDNYFVQQLEIYN